MSPHNSSSIATQGLNALHHASQLANAELSTKCVLQLTNLDFEAPILGWEGIFWSWFVDLIGCNHGRLQWRYSYPFSSWEGALGGEKFSFIPLFYANQNHQVLKHFLKIQVESLRILAVSGAFFLAILKLVQVLRIFIDRLPSLDFLNNRGETPLHYAACPPQRMESYPISLI